ncbi:hypothetical protein J6590_041343 [Homalodisca vitripennis]|nr:hypothetical protein J6590_041343 [Homalodisca vitripennis]
MKVNNKNSNPTSCNVELSDRSGHERGGAENQCACARPQTSTDVLKDRSRSDSADSSVDVCGVCEVLRGQCELHHLQQWKQIF